MKICTPLSQLLPVKNIPGIFEAVALLNDKTIFVNVVGGGEAKDLENLVMKFGLKSQVKFLGAMPNDKAREILKKSDVFILNSFHEGMPHALIEALAEGVPVIATKIPAVLEVLKDKKTGLLVNIDDPNDLAEKIKLVEKYKDTLVKNGKKLYLEKFTWEAHLKALYDTFGNKS